jgi:hypothetical protein
VPLPIVARVACATVLLARPASRRRRGCPGRDIGKRASSWSPVMGGHHVNPGGGVVSIAPLKRGAPPAVDHLSPSVHAGDNCFQPATAQCAR